jgi:hypothetical protein
MAYDDLINSAAAKYGLDPAALKRFVQIESGGDPNATTGSYMGLLQLSPTEFRARGGQNIFDPGQNLDVGAAKLAGESSAFAQKYGHAPDASDLYLIHQQGAGGAEAHMSNPSAPAWQNMYSTGEGQSKGPGWAKQAIWGNIPDQDKARFGSVDNVSSQDFMNLWRNRVSGNMTAPLANGADADLTGQAGALAAAGGLSDPTTAAAASAVSGATSGLSGVPAMTTQTPQASSGGLFGALGVNPSNIGGSGIGITGGGVSIPGLGTLSMAGNSLAQNTSDASAMQPLSMSPLRKPLDMRGIYALTQQPRLGIL